MLDGSLSNSGKRIILKHQIGILVFEHHGVLLHQGILRFGKNTYQIFFGKLFEGSNNGNTANEFRDHAKLMQVFRQHLGK